MASIADKTMPYIPSNSLQQDGWSNDTEATATCYCGTVQLALVGFFNCSRSTSNPRYTTEKNMFDGSLSYVRNLLHSSILSNDSLFHCMMTIVDMLTFSQPTERPGLVDVFVCNCTDCRKITASMFASNIIVKNEYVKHLRGLENLKAFGQSATTESGKTMTNWFCHTCGTLMYRTSEKNPGLKILRLGTVDDFNLAEVRILGASWESPSYFFSGSEDRSWLDS